MLSVSVDTPAVDPPRSPTIDDVTRDVPAFVDLRDPNQLGDVLNRAIEFAHELPGDRVTSEALTLRLAEVPGAKAPPAAALTVLVWAAGDEVPKKDLVAHINQKHPALHQSMRVALSTSAGVHVADLSERRPSIPPARYDLVRALDKMPAVELKTLRAASEQARLAGRHGSWAAVLQSWDAADSRSDPQAAMVAAYTFRVYDEARKQLPAPVKPAPNAASVEDLRLGKIQETFVARVDRATPAALRIALGYTHRFDAWPLSPATVLKEWNAFTTIAVQKYKQNGRQADPESELRHLAYAMAFVITKDAPATTAAELDARMKRYVDAPLAAPQRHDVPAHASQQKTPAPTALAPAPSQIPTLRLSPKEKALRHFDAISLEDRRAIISAAAEAYSHGPELLEQKFAQHYDALREKKGDPKPVIALAVAMTVPSPHVVRVAGAAVFSHEKPKAAVASEPLSATDKKSVEKLVKDLLRQKDKAPPLITARQLYAGAALQATAPDLRTEKCTKDAVIWAHAVASVQSKLPTDWTRVVDELIADD